METIFKISIPEPCSEDWGKMMPNEKGRFCSSCAKTIIDFTNKSKDEIIEYLTINKGKKVCGIVKSEQMGKFDLQIPQSALNQKMPFNNSFLLVLFIVMGATLFSCKNHNNDTLGEVLLVKDSMQNTSKKQIIVPSKKDGIPDDCVNDPSNKTSHKNKIAPPPPPTVEVRVGSILIVKQLAEQKINKENEKQIQIDSLKNGE